MQIKERLTALRAEMASNGIDAYIIPSTDAHQSEYVASHWKSREWISGFTGSAGIVVVTKEKACLWADGRYHIQAEQQLRNSSIDLFKMGLDNIPTFYEWIEKTLDRNSTIGFDGRTISINLFKKMNESFSIKDMQISSSLDLIQTIWENRDKLPGDIIFEHKLEFSGKSRIEKINETRNEMLKKGVDGYLISSLDDIAWLFNIRCTDVVFTPVCYAYAYISENKVTIFVKEVKFTTELKNTFIKENIEIADYDEIFNYLKNIDSKTVFINPDKTSYNLREALPKGIKIVEGIDITTNLKAIKNPNEVANIELTQISDGIAMVRFIMWIKEAVKNSEIEEADIHDWLHETRKKAENYFSPSFSTIAGYMENAALMHYTPIKGSSTKLKPNGIVLVDTGGQYYSGTTDITRTIVLGDISREIKEDFTIVLKSHIALASAKFLYGSSGVNLDIYARKEMWQRGLDYKCGSGHGVGYFLSVHEGPQGFSQTGTQVKLEENMYITNEPGIYKANKWGIRTENTLMVKEDFTNENGRFMKFETISYCPIDLLGIDENLLTQEEKKWINDYHRLVYDKLSKGLSSDEQLWLSEATKAI